MNNILELQLRRLALACTALVVLLIVWSGVRLWLLAEPEPIGPAEDSLRVDRLGMLPATGDRVSQSLAQRPLFWKNREPFSPSANSGLEATPAASGSDRTLDDVVLQGVFTGDNPGIIVSYLGERRRLAPKDKIGNWEFTMISPDSAVFESGDDIRTLNLEHAVPAAVPKKRLRSKKEPKSESNAENTAETGEEN